MTRPLLLLAFALSLPAYTPASADTLLIERTRVSVDADLPRRGNSMAQVHRRYGAPERKHAAVGGGSRSTPPITRWDYGSFSVYFENSHVVNAVLAKASPLELGPAPASSR